MSILPYELAKELKESGWPQPEFVSALSDRWVWPPNKSSAPFSTWAGIRVYSPSLSELIAKCTELLAGRFMHISISGDKCAVSVANLRPEAPSVEWFDVVRIEEAVARTCLKLMKEAA